MLIIFENSKITAIDKELLQLLNIELEQASEIIKEIELKISSIKEEDIIINNEIFEISEKKLLSIKNISAFELIYKKSGQTIETISPIEKNSTETIIENQEPESISIKPIAPIEEEPIKEENKIEKKVEIEIPKTETSEPKLNEITNIEIEFEDTKDELYQLLSNKEKIKNNITKELKSAIEELSIDESLANELFEDLLKQIENEKADIYKNLENRDHEKLHRNYHKLKGAALNLRLQNLALILKNLDELSKMRENINTLQDITDKFYEIIDYIKANKKSSIDIEAIKKKLKSNPILKKYVTNTIKSYLETNNEVAFEKNKKYLEKLLGITISSPEDLKEIMKGLE